MKVVFISHYSDLYGANHSLLNLIDGLKEHNVESFLLCPSRGEMTVELEKRSIPFSVLPFKNWMSSSSIISRIKSPARLIINMAILPVLVNQVKRWNADVIYTNSSVTPIGALIAMILKKPHIWHIREFGNLDYQLQYDWGEKFFKYWLNKSDAIIAISNAVRQIVLNGIYTKIYVIYNGVISKDKCDVLKKRTILLNNSRFNKLRNYTFAIVGLLNSNKGQEQAIKALAYLKKDYSSIRLLIVGSGTEEYLEYLKKLSGDLGIKDQVEFWGYISNPFKAYLKADAILMCSKYEAMGRVTAEAMAIAKPVIGYNNGGTSEIIENEATGLLYNGGYKDLAHCMLRFIENPRWAQELGINGWRKAQEEFTVEVCVKHVYEVLQEVVNK
ncbi:MAG: glycosyltransferase family 4 protein [Promethearchaeota archaeon]